METSVEIIPVQYDFVPDKWAEEKMVTELRRMLPKSESVCAWRAEFVQVVGTFSTRQKLTCPRCGAGRKLSRLELSQLGEMLSIEPADQITCRMICCDAEVLLSAINFDPIPRFASFGIRVESRRRQLGSAELKVLEEIGGCQFLQVLLPPSL